MRIIVFVLCFISMCSWQQAHASYELEQKANNTIHLEVQINTLLESNLTKTLLQSLLKEEAISLLYRDRDIVKFFSARNFNDNKIRALLSLILDLEFSDAIVSTKGRVKNVYYYRQSVKIKNKEALIEELTEKAKNVYLLVRLEEVEKDRVLSLRAIKKVLEELNVSQKPEFSLFALENEIKTLQVFNYLDEYLQELIFDMDFSKSKQVELEYMKKYGKHTLSFSNALAEYYLFLDRPQAALDTLKEIKNIQSYFSHYLNIIIAMRRGEIGLAELDLKKVLNHIETHNDLYPYFIVVKGSLAQMKGLNAQMCQAYKLACEHDLCDAYTAVQEDCEWLNN